MVVQIGRYISPPDIEAQLATSNYLYSHSLMFTADPFTYTGINAQIKLSRQWLIEVGIQAGNDMAPWQNSAQPNGEIMLGWQSPSNNDGVWFGVDSIGDGHYRHGHDDLQFVTATWGHKFSKLWHMQNEAYYEFQYDAAIGGSANDGPVEPYGAGGGQGAIIPGKSYAIGYVNYLLYRLNARDYLTLRTDYLDDPQGQRFGYRNQYSSHTFGYSHNIGPLTIIRPEIRYEHAYNNPVYDNGHRKEQYSFGIDLIQKF